MKINSLNNNKIPCNNVKPNKIEKSVQENIECKSSSEALSAYNIAFAGLTTKAPNNNDVVHPAQYLLEDLQMEPMRKYKISDDAEFDIVGNTFKLTDEWIKPHITSLRGGDAIILGRDNFPNSPNKMNISSKHILIGKNMDGSLVACDYNSTNGTKILKNTVCPDDFNQRFSLLPNKNYYLPKNSILKLADKSILNFSSYSKFFDKLKEGQKILVGRADDCDIKFEDSLVSRKHLSVVKSKDGYIVRDLHSTNGSFFDGIERPKTKLLYTHDYSFLQSSAYLFKSQRTLLPKDCQIVLNSNYVLDTRNNKLKQALDKKGSATVGKSHNCDIVVEDFYDVADYHAYIQRDGDCLFATDCSPHGRVDIVPKNSIKPFVNGVDNLKFSQSNIGDCYLLSTIYALSCTPKGQEIIKNMVSVDNDGNYWVEFFDHDPIKVRVDELDGHEFNSRKLKDKKSVKGDLGLKAIERAYGKMVKNPVAQYTLMAEIDDGGTTKKALKQICGLPSEYYYLKSHNPYKVLNDIATGNRNNMIITCATPQVGKYGNYSDKYHRFMAKHGYAIQDSDAVKRTVKIVNPHNTKNVEEISWDEFSEYFESVTIGHF